MSKVRIELQDISKSYYSETAVTQALRKISLTFCESEFVAITGESGSGKSTLLNIIGGMDTFDDGEMFVDGQATFQYDEADWEEYRRNKIGYVFQDYSLVGHYTALANVMSALLIMDCEKEEAEKTAMKYLEQVGLAGYETHKASELSSGQKQRLSIARALAKNTGIIVADEPTGNLDSETGNQIIRLLKELSKERLVIMVTHNYDQAAAYVTRKIRLHDGNIISDVQVEQGEESLPEKEMIREEKGISDKPAPEKKVTAEYDKKKEFFRQNQVAAYFAGLNRKTQKGRAVLFTVFLLVVSIVSFLFIGELFMQKEDTMTKKYSTVVFYKQDPTRLVVKRSDGGTITESDLKKLKAVSNVVTADSCDYANDCTYYIEQGRDYKYVYGVQSRRESKDEVKRVSFLNENHFVMSSDCITEDDLSEGRLPEARNEVVLYSEDKKLLDKEQLCYFMAHNLWGPNEYISENIKVVGLLKEKTEQVYFSKELCQMITMQMDSGEYRLYYMYDKDFGAYKMKPELIPVISDELEGNQVKLSYQYSGNPPVGEVLFHFEEFDENGNLLGEPKEQMVEVLQETHEMTMNIMQVSKEFYETYYQKESTQASVYLTSYAKVDSVIKKLEKAGYKAASTYRAGVTDYVENLVNERMVIIGISVFGLLVILLAQVLILRSLMKIRVKDYFVLKFIGMRMQIIQKISYFEIGVYSVTAMLITIIIMWILRLAGVAAIQEMMWYYTMGAYFAFVVYNLIAGALTVASFNHLLKGRLNA